MNSEIVGLILSAGQSSRMGQPKALIQWKEKSFLAWTLLAAKEAGIENSVVVIGAHADAIEPEARSLHLTSVTNLNWKTGMGSSLKCGMTYIQKHYPHSKYVLIQLADQPRVNAESLKKMLLKSRQNPLSIVCAKYENSLGVPAVFPQSVFPELLNLKNEEGAKRILFQHESDLIQVDLPEAAQDIDTPEQLREFLSQN